MKVIFLNTWSATVGDHLAAFIKEHRTDTDVFCFQEADGAMPALCQELLNEFSEITAHKFVTKDDDFYQATYVKHGINLISSGTISEDQANTGLGLFVEISKGPHNIYICNFHGMSRPVDKHDTPERFKQVQGLLDFCEQRTGPKIIGGDFNVFPSNESIQRFQQAGYKDLIHEYNITNTRNHFVWDRYPENAKQYFSDYAFVSHDVNVHTFSVPDIEISDHLPLILDVTLLSHIETKRSSSSSPKEYVMGSSSS
ncbi:MAG: endonuclease/exonuclease/phosphatase family protein [Candidatus Saccharimonadales bacterium]|jgi:endonuclease/exonuclease/phosphatase family metal-dependent hydrolase